MSKDDQCMRRAIEVRLDAKIDKVQKSPRMCVELSWDGGSTWTAAKMTPELSTSETTYLLGDSTDTWGRVWSGADFGDASFRVRITNVANAKTRDFSLDWIAVRLFAYTEDTSIDYTYDPLYRLTAADYDDGSYFYYTYDEVGNRLTRATDVVTSTYTYDDANRLTAIDGITQTWDANGNLLNDGVFTYAFSVANRLISVTDGLTMTAKKRCR
ncbi:hypothetical protein ACFLZW_00190 [Chloroflexota bacterium]